MTFFKNLKIVLSLDFEKNLLSQGKSFLLIHFTENARFCSWVLLFFFLSSFFSFATRRSCLQSSLEQILPLDPRANHRLPVLGKHHFKCNVEISCSDQPYSSWVCPLQRFKSILVMCACMLSHFSCIQLFVTTWTVAHQTPLSMGFSRQEYWHWLPCPPPRDLPDPGIKPASLTFFALAGRFFTTSTTWEAPILVISRCKTPKVHGALCQPFFPPQQEPPSVPQATLRPFFPPPCLPLEAAWAPVLS